MEARSTPVGIASSPARGENTMTTRISIANAVAAPWPLRCWRWVRHRLSARPSLSDEEREWTRQCLCRGRGVAEDASAVWCNPAGMSRFSSNSDRRGRLHMIWPSFKLNNNASQPAFQQPARRRRRRRRQRRSDTGDVYRRSDQSAVRVRSRHRRAVRSETEWDDGWLGRYQGLKSKMETMNVNPALSWKITDRFAVAAAPAISTPR